MAVRTDTVKLGNLKQTLGRLTNTQMDNTQMARLKSGEEEPDRQASDANVHELSG